MAGTRNQEVVQILTCLFPPPALSHRGACLQVGCPLGTCPAVETRAHHFGSARNCTASLLSQRPRWFLSFCLNWQYFGKRFSRDEVMSCTELVICCFDFLSHSRISEAVGVWGTHLQALKKKKKLLWKQCCWSVSLYAGMLHYTPPPRLHHVVICWEYLGEECRRGSSFTCGSTWASCSPVPLGELVLFASCTGNTRTIFLEEEFLSSLIKNFLLVLFF